MTIEEVKKILKNERECVERQDTPMCNRDECGCQCCDLILDTGKVLEAYELTIKALEFIEENYPKTFIDYLNDVQI